MLRRQKKDPIATVDSISCVCIYTEGALSRLENLERYSNNRVEFVVVVIAVSAQAGYVCASFRVLVVERRNGSSIAPKIVFKE